MRHPVLFLIVLVVLAGFALAYMGVLSFENSRDKTGVTIDKRELKQRGQEFINSTEQTGGELLDKASQELHKASKKVQGPTPGHAAPTNGDSAGREPSRREDRSGAEQPPP